MYLTLRQSRGFVSRLGTVVGIIFVLSVIDTFVSAHLQQKGSVRVLVGTQQAVSGELAVPVRSADEVHYRAESPVLLLQIVEARGRIWRGTLRVPLSASPGTYDLQVFSLSNTQPEKVPRLKVMIFDSQQALRASYLSITRKMLGIDPWWISIAVLPVLVALLFASYRLSTRQEDLLRRKGFTPIIKMARRKDHWKITATFAGQPLINTGDMIELVDPKLKKTAEMVVEKVENDRIEGRVSLDAEVRPDGYVHLSEGRKVITKEATEKKRE